MLLKAPNQTEAGVAFGFQRAASYVQPFLLCITKAKKASKNALGGGAERLSFLAALPLLIWVFTL